MGNKPSFTADFKVTPEQLRTQSDTVNVDVKTINTSFETMRKLVAGSEAFWQGEAGDEFRKTFTNYKEETDEIISRLSEHVTDLLQIAGIYDLAESVASDIIEELPNDVIV